MGRRLTLIAGSGALVPHVAGALQRTGEPLQIAASKTVKFTAGKAFKEAVNK